MHITKELVLRLWENRGVIPPINDSHTYESEELKEIVGELNKIQEKERELYNKLKC